MAIEGSENVKNMLAAVSGLQEALENAKSPVLQKSKAVFNRDELAEQLRTLADSVPETVRSAGKIVSDKENIIETARKNAESKTADADAQAKQMIASAQNEVDDLKRQAAEARNKVKASEQEAQQIITSAHNQAESDAKAIVANAQQQAEAILADATQQARQMVDNETILRRAKAEAADLTEKTQQQVYQLRQDTFAQLDSAFDRAEQYVGNLMQQMRQSREEMNGQR